MCIRDREGDDAIEAMRDEYDMRRKFLVSALNRMGTVSYTHLDVYKRQACCPAPPAGRGALRGAAFLQTNLFREQLMPRSFALQGKAKLSLSSTALSRTIFFPRFLFPRSRPPNGPLPGGCRADG